MAPACLLSTRLIVSSFDEAGCGEIMTMDRHFTLFKKKGLKITLLSL